MKIALFQRGDKGGHILEGLKAHGKDMDIEVFSVPEALPQIIDSPEEFIKEDFEADLILDYLYHNDLSEHLAGVAEGKKVPMILPGRKVAGAITPLTCCTFSIDSVPLDERTPGLVEYSRLFGLPDIEVRVTPDGRITEVRVKRGAPCGSTWKAAEEVLGLHLDEALPRFGLSVQHHCHAPTGYDAVLSRKAPLHLAADAQGDVFNEAVRAAEKDMPDH